MYKFDPAKYRVDVQYLREDSALLIALFRFNWWKNVFSDVPRL